MASVEQRELVPDEKILSVIFSGAPGVTLTSCNILSNTFDTCTFSIHLDASPVPKYPKDLLVRLETSGGRLASVASVQRIGHAQLPDLVPSVLDVGNTVTADGKRVEYSVTAFYMGTSTLEAIWDTMNPDHQLELVKSVVHAVEKLQRNVYLVDRKIEDVRSRLDVPYSLEDGASLPDRLQSATGGPNLGFSRGIKQFLGRILQASDSQPPHCTISETDGGIILGSAFEDIGGVNFTHSELDDLQQHVVFCHNDLEPRNILVRRIKWAEVNSRRYELAAIIDWEMAGFYPFAYEYGVKDTVLGSSNLSFSWYSLFKKQTSHLLPRGDGHTKLIKALRVIDESKKRSMARNVGVRVQAKWVQRENVELSSDLRRGWVPKAGARVPGLCTKNDQANLEMEVLRELGYV